LTIVWSPVRGQKAPPPHRLHIRPLAMLNPFPPPQYGFVPRTNPSLLRGCARFPSLPFLFGLYPAGLPPGRAYLEWHPPGITCSLPNLSIFEVTSNLSNRVAHLTIFKTFSFPLVDVPAPLSSELDSSPPPVLFNSIPRFFPGKTKFETGPVLLKAPCPLASPPRVTPLVLTTFPQSFFRD